MSLVCPRPLPLLLALAAFGHPLAACAQEPPPLDPSPHRTFMIGVAPDVRLEVLDWGGGGEPLVFLPGLGNTAHAFDTFAPRFRDRFHVYAITPRGFGASSRPDSGYDSESRVRDILATLDSLAIPRAILVGHSIAGDELSRFAAEHPRRVRALVYLDAYSYGSDAFHPQTPAPAPPPAPPMTGEDSASLRSVAAFLARRAGYRTPDGEILAHASFFPSGRLSKFGPPNESARVIAGTTPSEYRRIEAPALGIYARSTRQQVFPGYDGLDERGRRQADSIFSELRAWQDGQIRRFRTELRHGVVLEVLGAHHYVHYSDADEVEQAMRSFLEPPSR